MKYFEYMGKGLFKDHGIPVPNGKVAETPEEAAKIVGKLGSAVIKSQVLTGGRGKAGGVKFADSPEEAGEAADELLGQEIKGYKVEKVLVEEKLNIEKELYLAITIDSTKKSPVLIASTKGGMDIEEVPEEYIVKKNIDVLTGMEPFVIREIVSELGFDFKAETSKQFMKIVSKLYQAFRALDAELMEINPLVIADGQVIAADAKVTIDDCARYRQKDLPYVEEKTVIEKKAAELGLAYVELEGDIAVMANGAGMSMATLDILQYYGGKPANFLDAGGGAGSETMARAIELLLEKKPRVIFINIFGGITRCDDVANAITQVLGQQKIEIPVVIRLVGTNEEEGRRILEAQSLSAYNLMHEAAQKAVELARK